MGELGRFWCRVCQHGVKGEHGKPCPVCVNEKGRDNYGILQTGEEAIEQHKIESEAIKTARKLSTVKGVTGINEEQIAAKVKASVIAEIMANYNLVPKGMTTNATEAAKIEEEKRLQEEREQEEKEKQVRLRAIEKENFEKIRQEQEEKEQKLKEQQDRIDAANKKIEEEKENNRLEKEKLEKNPKGSGKTNKNPVGSGTNKNPAGGK